MTLNEHPYYMATSSIGLNPKKLSDTSWMWITLAVLMAHLLGTWVALQNITPTVTRSTQKVVVKTVQLNPRNHPLNPAKATPIANIPEETIIAQQEIPEAKQEPIPQVEIKPEPAPVATPVKAEEPISKPSEVVEPVKVAPKPAKVKEKPKSEATAPKKAESEKKKKSTPTAKAKQPPKKPPAKKTTTTKKTENQAPVKKQTPVTKKQKVEPKKKEPTKEEIAAKEADAAKAKELAAAKEAAKKREKELLSRAQENIAKIGQTRDKISSTKISSFAETAIPGQLENLQIDALPVGSGVSAELSAKEISYRDEVAVRLKSALKLPDYGKVKLKLTLNRSGKVATVVIVNSENVQNKEYIEKTVPKLIFPPFGTRFGDASQFTFMVSLNNDS